MRAVDYRYLQSMRLWLLIGILSWGLVTTAQEIVWADIVVSYSSAYDNKEYSAQQVLGPPSKLPATGRSTTAWSPRYPDMGREFIKVKFPASIPVQTILIGENLNPGAVQSITLYDTEGVPHEVYRNNQLKPLAQEGRLQHITIPPTPYEVESLHLILKTDAVPGYNQIDCIGISPTTVNYKAPIPMADVEFEAEKENLGASVNSIYGEVHPIISPDGQTLFFTRKEHPANYGVEQRDDIWYSIRDEAGQWSTAKNIGPPLNNTGHNYLNAITTDGTLAFLGGAYGNVNAKDRLYVTQKTAAGWQKPEEVTIANYYNLSNYNSFHISVDGKVILLSIEQEDALGLKDLYVSFKQANGTYSAPRNLGPELNTAGDEVTPFLAADGKTLYFSTDGRPGYGRNDIFMTKRLDDSWERWSDPLNLGPAVNTPNWDAYYTLPAKGDFAYFTSYDDSYGSGDIFRIAIPPAQKPEAVVLIRGQVIDATTHAPIAATIQYETDSATEELAKTNPGTGEYQLVLPIGRPVVLLANAEGYYAITQFIDLSNVIEYQERTVDLAMYPIRKGEVVPLNDINFEANSATLTTDSYKALNRVAGFLLGQSGVVIEIGGHTNNRCSSSYCKQLSASRAAAVADYLFTQGVPQAQVKHKGYGKDKPIDTNDTEQGRQRNQRVEFTILEVGQGN